MSTLPETNKLIDREALKLALTATKSYTESLIDSKIDEHYQAATDIFATKTELSEVSESLSYVDKDTVQKKLDKLFPLQKPVGGTIYYVNPDVIGDYKFYREDGSEITGWSTVDDLTEAYTYEKLSDNVDDKFYVFDNNLATSKSWTYHNGSDYQYEQIFTTPSATYEIGQGRINTQTVMAKDDGKYITDNSNGYATIWYVCNEVNKSERGGCSDWFIPSQKELDALRTSSVVPSNWFSSNYIWTSSESSDNDARDWDYGNSSFYDDYKNDYFCCVCVRAF